MESKASGEEDRMQKLEEELKLTKKKVIDEAAPKRTILERQIKDVEETLNAHRKDLESVRARMQKIRKYVVVADFPTLVKRLTKNDLEPHQSRAELFNNALLTKLKAMLRQIAKEASEGIPPVMDVAPCDTMGIVDDIRESAGDAGDLSEE